MCKLQSCLLLSSSLACLYSGIQLSLMPRRLYSLLACSYMGSMLASNSALAYINYPMQVLGKACKPIPGERGRGGEGMEGGGKIGKSEWKETRRE